MNPENINQIKDRIQELKQYGFVMHLKAANVSDKEIGNLLDTYRKQDSTRTSKLEGARQAILDGLK